MLHCCIMMVLNCELLLEYRLTQGRAIFLFFFLVKRNFNNRHTMPKKQFDMELGYLFYIIKSQLHEAFWFSTDQGHS
jgi:hypothetical protein